jgi:hypothetical protein
MKSEFLSWKSRVTTASVSVVSMAVIMLPFAVGNYQIFMSSFNWQNGRPPWGTVYAFIMWVLNKPFPTDPIYNDYSGINASDWGWTGITPIPSIMTTPVPDYNLWYNWVSMLLIGGQY